MTSRNPPIGAKITDPDEKPCYGSSLFAGAWLIHGTQDIFFDISLTVKMRN